VAAYLLPTFPLGYFWHLTTFRDRYERLEMYRTQVIIPFGLASMVVQALAFAWLYPHLFSTGRDAWLRGAVGFGVLFGTLAWSFTTLPVAAKYRMTSVRSFLLLESAFTVIQFVIVSPLVAWAWRDAV
jgi:hypothetical protein